MITFKYKGNGKRFELGDRMTEDKFIRSLTQLFPLKGSVLGFRSQEGIYYDVESLLLHRAEFQGTIVELIQGNEHLEISFSSDNVSSLIPMEKCNSVYIPSQSQGLVSVQDLKAIESYDNNIVVVFILVEDKTKEWVIDRVHDLSQRYLNLDVLFGYHMAAERKKHIVKPPLFVAYQNKKRLCEVRITANWEKQMDRILQEAELPARLEDNSLVKTIEKMERMDDDCPSFVTTNIMDRLSKELVVDNLNQMYDEHTVTENELDKMVGLANNNFMEFCRLFCRNLSDTDYDTFKNEIEAHLQRFRVEDNDFFQSERPISREEQRKRSNTNIEILKVEEYLEILDELVGFISDEELTTAKGMLLEENNELLGQFASYQQGTIDKASLANYISEQFANHIEQSRPISRCLPRDKPKDIIPEFGQKSEINLSLSPIHRIGHIAHNCDLENTLNDNAARFESSQLGMLLYLLEIEDSELLWLRGDDTTENRISKLKELADRKYDEILKRDFKDSTVDYFNREKDNSNSPIYIILQNFRYESNPTSLIQELKAHAPKDQMPKLHKQSSFPSLSVKAPIIDKFVASGDCSRNESEPLEDDSFWSQTSTKKQEEVRHSVLNNFYNTLYWQREFLEMANSTLLSTKHKEMLTRCFKLQSPSVYMIIRQYIIAKQQRLPFNGQMIREQVRREPGTANPQLLKYHLFKAFVIEYTNTGKMSEEDKDWLMLAFIEEKMSVVAAFEAYLINKSEGDFLETLSLVLKMRHLKIEKTELESFIKRIVYFLKQIYEHSNILDYTIRTYNAAFRGICEKEQMTFDSEDFFESMDLLNSYSFNKRFNREMAQIRLPLNSRAMIIKEFQVGETELMNGLIDVFETGKSFPAFIKGYDQKCRAKTNERASIEKTLKEISISINNPRILGAMKHFDESDPNFCSIWEVYKSTNDVDDFVENLIIFLNFKSPQKPISNLPIVNQSPILRKRFEQDAEELLSLINEHSQKPEEDIAIKLREYEEREKPVIVKQILRGLGLTSDKINQLLEKSSTDISNLILKYLSNGNKEEFTFEIDPFLSALMPREEYSPSDS